MRNKSGGERAGGPLGQLRHRNRHRGHDKDMGHGQPPGAGAPGPGPPSCDPQEPAAGRVPALESGQATKSESVSGKRKYLKKRRNNSAGTRMNRTMSDKIHYVNFSETTTCSGVLHTWLCNCAHMLCTT